MVLACGQAAIAAAAFPNDLILIVYDPVTTQTYIRDLGTSTFVDTAGQTFASDANWNTFFVAADAANLKWSILGNSGTVTSAAAQGAIVFTSVLAGPVTPTLAGDGAAISTYNGIASAYNAAAASGSFINTVTTSGADFNVIAQDGNLGFGTVQTGLTDTLGLVKSLVGLRSALTTTQFSAGSFSLDAAGVLTYGGGPPRTQTISFPNPSARPLNAPPPVLAAQASSLLAVSYTVLTPAVCRVTGSTVVLLTPGVCTLAADQAGNGFYLPAAQVQASFTISDATGQLPALAAGDGHTCALDPAGAVTCWGSNSFGQLGSGSLSAATGIVHVSGLDTAIVSIAAGDYHSCALRLDGAVLCWGANASGQLGNGNTTPSAVPRPVIGLPSGGAQAIALGAEHSCALTSAGVYCWGAQRDGQLGNGVVASSPQPVAGPVQGLPFQPAGIAAGSDHTCAWNAAGALCWGYDAFGQLGIGRVSVAAPIAAPTPVSGLDQVKAMVAGRSHSCAQRSDGSVLCWGNNSEGELATGTFIGPVALPMATTVDAADAPAAIASSNGFHSCARTTSGNVQCWGYNAFGQLGDGTNANRNLPVDVPGVQNASTVTTGTFHSCAVVSGGVIRCWGDNTFGQLGDGTTTASAVAVAVAGLSLTPAPQRIVLPALPDLRIGTAPFTVTAQASSALPVSLASGSPQVCSVVGPSVTLLAPGVCTLTASQSGNPAYAAAPQATASFQVLPLLLQSISFSALSDQILSATPISLVASANSGLAVSFASLTPAACNVVATSVQLLAAGPCSISASQPGNADYAAAQPVVQTFAVLRASQVIDVPTIADQTMATGRIVPVVHAGSGLPVTLRSTTRMVCVAGGGVVSFIAPGTCTLIAEQGGDANFLPAAPVSLAFVIRLTPQVIHFAPPGNLPLGTPAVLSASASSGLPVYFLSLTPGVCSITGNAVSTLGIGQCVILAAASGNAVYDVAPAVSQSLLIVAPVGAATEGDVPLPPWSLLLLAGLLGRAAVRATPLRPGTSISSGRRS